MTVLSCPQLWPISVLLGYPVYLLMMVAVLRVGGVSKEDTAKWLLRQADRQRFTDLLRVARGLPKAKPDTGSQDP